MYGIDAHNSVDDRIPNDHNFAKNIMNLEKISSRAFCTRAFPAFDFRILVLVFGLLSILSQNSGAKTPKEV